jgi:two-component system, OmpR family, sensor histidine kinase MprB
MTAADQDSRSKPAKKTKKTKKSANATRRKRAQAEQTQPRRRSIATAIRGMSLRTRVSLLVMVTVGLTLAVGSIVSYMVVRNEVINRVDQDLQQRTSFVRNAGLADPDVLLQPADSRVPVSAVLYSLGLEESLVGSDGSTIEPPPIKISVQNGQTITVRPAAPVGQPEIDVANGSSDKSVRTVVESDGTYRVIAVPLGRGLALVIATPMAATLATLHTLGLVSVILGVLGVAIAGTAGFFLGRAALRPVERLTVATEYIARTGDLRRIEVTGDDELARLTTSFNTMLVALARSQDYQRRLVADAGHELRTPLTSMRTNLDLLAQAMAEPDNPRLSAEDRVELMNDVRAQMEELSLLISDLVELSRDERPVHAIEQIDFSEVVERAVQRVQRRASSLTYDVQLAPWYLQGDPAALERAVTNLLDNAAKWSPPGGSVTVSLREGALQVSDQGPGIADEDLPHIFERFYRSPEARTMPGSGLGLAIVRQVAENHGGRVAAARAPGGGALLGVWLPGVTGPTAEESANASAVASVGTSTRGRTSTGVDRAAGANGDGDTGAGASPGVSTDKGTGGDGDTGRRTGESSGTSTTAQLPTATPANAPGGSNGSALPTEAP